MPVNLVSRPSQYPRPIVVSHRQENSRFRPSCKIRENHAALQIPAQSPFFFALSNCIIYAAINNITNGKVHDVNVLDEIALEAGAFYVMQFAATGVQLPGICFQNGDAGLSFSRVLA
ncbi:MAG TPA: hypothetical protein VMV98_05440 [Acidobacteriaceae bacterium]|nr:hypothetical protein [Acidobacteriaceae bacterium]